MHSGTGRENQTEHGELITVSTLTRTNHGLGFRFRSIREQCGKNILKRLQEHIHRGTFPAIYLLRYQHESREMPSTHATHLVPPEPETELAIESGSSKPQTLKEWASISSLGFKNRADLNPKT